MQLNMEYSQTNTGYTLEYSLNLKHKYVCWKFAILCNIFCPEGGTDVTNISEIARFPDSHKDQISLKKNRYIHVRDPISKFTSFLEEQNSNGNKLYFLVVIHTGGPNIIKK